MDSICRAQMPRRTFVTIIAGSLLAAPLAAEAQPTGKVVRIGYLSLQRSDGRDGDTRWVAAFRQGLRDLGYVEGGNVAIEQRHAAGRADRLPALASELVRLELDVLVVFGLAALVDAGWKAPGALPIVFTIDPDPVGRGLVASLAHPGGNVTGLSDAHADLVPKRLELLKEAAPSVARVGVLFNPASSLSPAQLKAAQAAGPALGMTIRPVEIRGRERGDIDRAFEAMGKERSTGLLILGDPTIGVHRSRIVELAVKRRLPAVSTLREWAEAGLLMSYGTDFHDLWRRAATYVDKILKGAKPGDLPVEQPTKFDLLINLKTAKALGLPIPSSLLLRADQVIE
ncbi:MAG TPA: ABC transporter substrate-binding protein [Methylomirabilota bacterium]|jgi:putative ABC transport system substrate-binding protein